jgi:hypothetical protein
LKIAGYIDHCDPTGFDGWIIDHDNPQMKFRLAVYCGAILLGTCVADQFRQDLADGGLADGHCGFKFDLPNTLSTAQLHELNVSVIDTRYAFPFRVGSPIIAQTPGMFYERVAKNLYQSGRRWQKFETCILHIGTEKTGSTSLQTCFGLNRAAFADKGYFVPLSLASSSNFEVLNHIYLAVISRSDEEFSDDLRLALNILDRDALNRTRRDVFIKFSEEIATTSCGCHTVILSNEHCHSRLLTLEEVQKLKDFLDHFCESYKIVVYLRPQHELAMSQYGMLVANGIWDIDIFQPFPEPSGYNKLYTPRAYFDYRALLERWSEVFGEDSLDPRIYPDGYFPQRGDVVADFVAALSLGGGELVSPPRSNTATSARAQAFLTNFYRYFGNTGQFGAIALHERVRDAALACLPGPGLTPDRSQVVAFLQEFAEGNEAIRLRWFPQRQRLFELNLETYPTVASPIMLSPKETEDIYKMLMKDQELCCYLTPEAWSRIQKGLPPRTE